MTLPPRKKDDKLLKGAFEETFPYLLRFFFKEADQLFDLEKGIEFLEKELNELFPELEKKGGHRIVDMLARVYLKDGRQEWILFHVEIQGHPKEEFAKRMFTYYYRILDRYGVNMSALAVFTSGKKQDCTDTFHKTYLDTEITYKFKKYHVLDHTQEELLAMENPFALIMLAAQKALLRGKVPEEELGEGRLTVARALLKSQKISRDKILYFLNFLKNFVYISSEEINIKFDKEIERITEKHNVMGIIEATMDVAREEGIEKGIQKGIEKGRQEREYEFVKSLLLNTDFDIEKIAVLSEVSKASVIKIRQEIQG